MVEWPEWLNQALLQRVDDLEAELENDQSFQERREQTNRLLQKLKTVLNEEQMKLLMEWEERLYYHLVLEKEQMYQYGLLDGLQSAAYVISNRKTNGRL